jgi:toxin ParE1/3/4
MSLTIVRSPQAKRDVLNIAYYLAETSLDKSDEFLRAIEETYRFLAETPGAGTLRDYDNPQLAGMRMWPVPGFRKYLIFYRTVGQRIKIIHVLHGAQDLQRIFGPEEE